MNFKVNRLISYYWIPRIVSSLVLLYSYKFLHLYDSGSILPDNRFSYFFEADIDKYINNYTYNYLYTFINTNFFDGNNKLLLGIICGQLISSFSILSIFKSTKKLLKNIYLPNIILFLLAIHPMLVLYSLKFSTDNFMILGLSFFMRSIIIDKNNNQKRYFLKKGLNFVFLFLCLLINAKLLPLVLVDIFLFFSKSLKNLTSIMNKRDKLLILFGIFFIILLVFRLTIFIALPYVDSVALKLWDGNFPLKAADIYNQICNQLNCIDNSLINYLFKIFSWILYIPPALIFLTGARARFADLPWEFSFGGISINSFKKLYEGQNLEIMNNFNQTNFFLIILLPLLLFSVFHITGLINYLIKFREQKIKVYLAVISLIFIPILFYPVLRYFIPLIPFSCIGSGLLIYEFFTKKSTQLDPKF